MNKKNSYNKLFLLLYILLSIVGYFALYLFLQKNNKTLPLLAIIIIALIWIGIIIAYMLYIYKKSSKNNTITISNTTSIAFTALATALICVITLIYIPIPGGGYIHIGDSIIFLFSYLLPLPFVVLAAGIGSALADIVSGYAVYAIPTLLIKASMTIIARYFIMNKASTLNLLLGFIVSSLFMQIGYLLVEIILFGETVGIMKFLFGLIQSVASIPLAMIFIKAFKRVPDIERIRNQWTGM